MSSKPYLCISCSYTPGVERYFRTLQESGFIEQVQPIVFMWEPYFGIPDSFLVYKQERVQIYKQGKPYQNNRIARLPLLSVISDLGLDSWYIWTDAQDVAFQKSNFDVSKIIHNKGTDVYLTREHIQHRESAWWAPKCIGEYENLLHEEVYNSGCFAMNGHTFLKYLAKLSITPANNEWQGDQLIFNAFIQEEKLRGTIEDTFFGSLYTGFTGPKWTGDYKKISPKKNRIQLEDGKFVADGEGPIAIIHAPGSTKEILDKVYYKINPNDKLTDSAINVIYSTEFESDNGAILDYSTQENKILSLFPTDDEEVDFSGSVDEEFPKDDEEVAFSRPVATQKEKEVDTCIPKEDNADVSNSQYLLPGLPDGEIASIEITSKNDKSRKITFGAVLPVYNEEATIAYTLKSIYHLMDKIIITTSDFTWAGIKQPLDQTVNIIKAFPDPEKKIYLIEGKWKRDDYARNVALDFLEDNKIDYALIVDGDEAWDGKDLLTLQLFAASNPEKAVFRSPWWTCWKDTYHRIDPPENYFPVVMVKVKDIRFYWIRDVIEKSQLPFISRDAFLGEKAVGYQHKLTAVLYDIKLHHFSWSRPDDLIKEKIEKSPHKKEFIENWYENVWLGWNKNPDMENLHPTYPPQYKRVIQIPTDQLSRTLSDYDIEYIRDDNNDIIKLDIVKIDQPDQKPVTPEHQKPKVSEPPIAKEKEIKKEVSYKEITLNEINKHGKVLRESVVNYFTTQYLNCSYLEIGSADRQCFLKIKANIKHDIEPAPRGITPHFKGTSDEFFRALEECKLNSTYNVIFIDGMHKCEQVLRDVKSANKHLSKDGFIILHDCLPKEHKDQERTMTEANRNRWLGDVWKAQAWLVAQFPNVYTLSDTDQGCGVIVGRVPDFDVPSKEQLCDNHTWRDYITDKEELLRCQKWETFIANFSN